MSIHRPSGKIYFRSQMVKSILSNEIVTEDGGSLSIDYTDSLSFDKSPSYAFNLDMVNKFVYKYVYMPNSIIPEVELNEKFVNLTLSMLGIGVKEIDGNVSLVDWTYISSFTDNKDVFRLLGEMNDEVEKSEDFSEVIEDLEWKGKGLVIRYFLSLHGDANGNISETYPVIIDIFYKEI